jgi:hypothetical protein
MKYAYIESVTGIVWAASSKEFTVAEIAANITQVDSRRDDAPDTVVARASALDHYHKWNGSDYEIVWVLADLKAEKNYAINMRTRELIAEGVTYAGKVFPLDLPDQSTWHGIWNAVAANAITYPIKVMDKNDDPFYLSDAVSFQTMYLSGFGEVGAILESGRVLKAQVNACTTKAEIDAIVDNR